jgi:phosphoribosylaminoimidazolecarboxamide formyltransferase / IMP cyclohydrolase
MPLYLFSSPAAAKLATGPHASLHRRRQFLFRVPHRPVLSLSPSAIFELLSFYLLIGELSELGFLQSRRAPLLTSAAERPAGRTMATADTGASTVTDSRLRGGRFLVWHCLIVTALDEAQCAISLFLYE